MIYPQNIEVCFIWGIKAKEASWIMDSPKWINIHPTKSNITSYPNIINVKLDSHKHSCIFGAISMEEK